MDRLIQEPYSDTDKLADDALEELNSLGLGYGAHTAIGMALGKLKTYEGTGLTPEQVEAQRHNLEVAYKMINDISQELSRAKQYYRTLEPKLLEEIGKRMFRAVVYNKDFNGSEINNLLCFGDVAEVIVDLFEEVNNEV